MDAFDIFWRGLTDAIAGVPQWFARRGRVMRTVLIGTVGTIAAGVLFVFLLPSILGLFAPKLDLNQDLYAANRPIALTFVDAQGEVVGHRGAIVGQRLTLTQMPAYLPAAFIAMEDRSFWTNPGFDIKGLIRATWLDLRAGHVVAGGSTITQQVAKIVFLTQNRTFSRKYQELLDTAALNKSLSKAQILELYLNRIYLGSGAYGVDGAAHVYFGKSAKDLTLAEAAMLATLTRAPSAFSPRRDLEAAQDRAKVVLMAMVDTGAITKAEAADAEANPAVIADRSIADARNYYFDTAADEAKMLATEAGHPPSGDLIVHTAFEPKLQDAARRAVAHVLGRLGRKDHASQAAVVVMKPDGAVAALIGGRAYDDSTFNRATQAHRQPGSSFKPFVYLAALEQGVSPWDLREDEPIDVHGWTPTNYGGEQFGTITVAEALAHSVNTITVALEQQVGVGNVIAAARRCGIASPLAANASLALGTSEVTPLELTGAYAAFANGGVKVAPYLVTEVDESGGTVLYKRQAPKPQRIIADHVDRDLTTMLYGVVTSGTGVKAALSGYQAAGKTGTTQDNHDAWFEGFTADYVAGVWVGNDDMSPMRGVTGGSLPAEIWHLVMTAAEKGRTPSLLAMNPVQPPNGEEDGAFSQGEGDGGFLDNGASNPGNADNADSGDTGDSSSAPAAPARPHNFWNWLFGRDDAPPADNGPAQDGAPPARPPTAPPAPPQGGQQTPHYQWRSDGQNGPSQPAQPGQRQYGLTPSQQ